jgi:hypothetical protein
MNAEMQRARRRQMFIFLLVAFGMVVLLARLYYWQILQSHSGYNLAQQASEEHLQNQVLDAPRGLIFDSAGRILASNIIRDDVYVEPDQFAVDHPNGDPNGELQAIITALHGALPQVSIQTLQNAFNMGIAQGRWLCVWLCASTRRKVRRCTTWDCRTCFSSRAPGVCIRQARWPHKFWAL